MNPGLFWKHTSVITYPPGVTGFRVFSVSHFCWFAASLVFIVLFSLAYRRGSDARRRNMRNAVAAFLIHTEFLKLIVMILTGAPVGENLPLEICSFAEYAVLIDALCYHKRPFHQMMAFAFFPAAAMALLFPTVTGYPDFNFYTIRYFTMHASLAAYFAAHCAAGEIRPRYRGLWTSLGASAFLALIIRRIDQVFGKNYMFQTDHVGNPMLKLLWDISGGNGGIAYFMALACFVCIVMHAAYLIYRLIGLTGGGRGLK